MHLLRLVGEAENGLPGLLSHTEQDGDCAAEAPADVESEACCVSGL